MKILHCSDIHLGKRPFGTENFSQKRYEDYFKVFDELIEVAIAENIEVFMVAGDLFDKRELTPDILARSENCFRKLSDAGIKLFITEGNHDNSNTYDEVNSWLHYLEERDIARRISYTKNRNNRYNFQCERVGDVNFYGVGFPGFNVDNIVKALSEVLNPEEKNIVLIHTALGGDSPSLPGLVKSESLRLLQDRTIYVAGGHLHSKKIYPAESRFEKPFFFIPGSPEYWNVINEKSSEKGAFIFDSDTLEYRYIHLNPRKRIKESFNISSTGDSIEKFRNWVETLNLTGEELVVVEAKILNNLYVNVKQMEETLEEMGALKGYVVPFFVNSSFEEEYDGITHTSTEEIETAIIREWSGFGNSTFPEHLKELKEIQKERSDFQRFMDIFDEVLEGMIADEN